MRPSLTIDSRDVPAHLEASFWTLVQIDWRTGCWIWNGMSENRYGRFKLGSFKCAAHRLAYALAYGHCPANLVVRHECDVPLCVAPHHLILGTDAQNIADRESRGRGPQGERNGTAILSEEDIIAIRGDTRRAVDIGAIYGVSKSTVNKIRERRIWRHLP